MKSASHDETSRLTVDGVGMPAVIRYVIDDNGDRVPDTGGGYDGESPIRSCQADDEYKSSEKTPPAGDSNIVSDHVTPVDAATRLIQKSSIHRTGAGPKSVGVQINDPPLTETRSYYTNDEEWSMKWESSGSGIPADPFHSAMPTMPLALAITCCVFNILLPGSGTIISAFSVFCRSTSTRLQPPLQAFAINLAVGLLQLGLFIVIVGWIWSIHWGMTFIQLARTSDRGRKASSSAAGGGSGCGSSGNGNQVSYYVRRHSSIAVGV